MARLPYIETADLAPENQDLLKREIALYKQLVNSPNALRAFQGLGQFIRYKSTVDSRLRELAILQVGYLTRSAYEYAHHIKIGFDFGVSPDDIRGLIAESNGQASSLEPLARTVLRGAREMTTDLAMSDATFAELRRHLSERFARHQTSRRNSDAGTYQTSAACHRNAACNGSNHEHVPPQA